MPDKKKPPTKLGVKMQNTQITTKVKEPKYGLYLLSTSPTAQDAAWSPPLLNYEFWIDPKLRL